MKNNELYKQVAQSVWHNGLPLTKAELSTLAELIDKTMNDIVISVSPASYKAYLLSYRIKELIKNAKSMTEIKKLLDTMKRAPILPSWNQKNVLTAIADIMKKPTDTLLDKRALDFIDQYNFSEITWRMSDMQNKIRHGMIESLMNHESPIKLARKLYQIFDTYEIDMRRVAITETTRARNKATLMEIKQSDPRGEDALIYFMVAKDACKMCKKLYLYPDGTPRIFKVRDIENLSNKGKKQKEWTAALLIHPNDRCFPQRYNPALDEWKAKWEAKYGGKKILIQSDIEKAIGEMRIGHKYIKREGPIGGPYQYTYQEDQKQQEPKDENYMSEKKMENIQQELKQMFPRLGFVVKYGWTGHGIGARENKREIQIKAKYKNRPFGREQKKTKTIQTFDPNKVVTQTIAWIERVYNETPEEDLPATKPEEKATPVMEVTKTEELQKAITGGMKPGHKWIKREGTPGNYKYTYEEGQLPCIEIPGQEQTTNTKTKPLSQNEPGFKLNTYQQRIEANMTKMGSDLAEWTAINPSKITETTNDKGESVMMPEFEFPKDYIHAPVLFPNQTTGGAGGNCELCGHPIKEFYWIKNDKRKWIMAVGSECVTNIESGMSGHQIVGQAKAKHKTEKKSEEASQGRLLHQQAKEITQLYTTLYRTQGYYENTWSNEDYRMMTGLWQIMPSSLNMEEKTDQQVINWAKKSGKQIEELIEKMNDRINKSRTQRTYEGYGFKVGDTITLLGRRDDINRWGKEYIKEQPITVEALYGANRYEYVIQYKDKDGKTQHIKTGDYYIEFTDIDTGKQTVKPVDPRPNMQKSIPDDPAKKAIDIHGVKIGIEWPKGSTRTYKDNPSIKTPMTADYGYVSGTESNNDEMSLDCYVGPNHKSMKVFKLTQIKPDTGEFDENKYMLGYNNPNQAIESYLKHMPAKFYGGIKEIYWPEFEHVIAVNLKPVEIKKSIGELKTHKCINCKGRFTATDQHMDSRDWACPLCGGQMQKSQDGIVGITRSAVMPDAAFAHIKDQGRHGLTLDDIKGNQEMGMDMQQKGKRENRQDARDKANKRRNRKRADRTDTLQ